MSAFRNFLLGAGVSVVFWASARSACAQAFTDMNSNQKHDYVEKKIRSDSVAYGRFPKLLKFMLAYDRAADPTTSTTSRPNWDALAEAIKTDAKVLADTSALGVALSGAFEFILGTEAPGYEKAAMALVRNGSKFLDRKDPHAWQYDFYDKPKNGVSEEQLALARQTVNGDPKALTPENLSKIPDYLAGPLYIFLAARADPPSRCGGGPNSMTPLYADAARQIAQQHKSTVGKYLSARNGLNGQQVQNEFEHPGRNTFPPPPAGSGCVGYSGGPPVE